MAANGARSQSEVWNEVSKAQASLSKNVGGKVNSAKSESSLQLALEDRRVVANIDEYIKRLEGVTAGQTDVVGYAFAINAQRPDLVEKINQGLRAATTNGDAGRLYIQWLANLTPTEETFRSGLYRAAWVIVPLLALAVLLLVWGNRARALAGVAERRASHLQRHDPVTQLPNRASFRRTLGGLIGTRKPFAVVRVDLMELGAVEAIASRDDVSSVEAAAPAKTNVGVLTSQGNVSHGANKVIQNGIDGRGVTVGVLSDSASPTCVASLIARPR